MRNWKVSFENGYSATVYGTYEDAASYAYDMSFRYGQYRITEEE